MPAFRIRYIKWLNRPELNVAEGPFFDIHPKEQGRLIRCIHVLLAASDIQSLKNEMHLERPEEDAEFKRVVIRYAVQRIEQGLKEGLFPNPPGTTTDNLFIIRNDFPILRQMLQEKTCEYQIKEGRGLLCTAAAASDSTVHSQRGFEFIAPTTQALCRACALPDTDYLCSHFTHPEVIGHRDRGTLTVRQLVSGLCNIGQTGVNKHPERCHAAGHECWERLIESVQQSIPISIPALPEVTVARIFLCHASEDKPQVRKVYQQLKARGFTPWLDEVDILPGQNCNYEIEQALETSEFVIVFLSTRSVKKIGYVQREFKNALRRMEEMPEGFIHTIPVMLDDCVAPRQFRSQQWVKLYEDGAFDRVVNAIRHGLQERGQPVPERPAFFQEESPAENETLVATRPPVSMAQEVEAEQVLPDLTTDKATPALAPERRTIREKSAAEILGNLKGITPSYRFHEKVKELYLGRWTREPGWEATVHGLPSESSKGYWHCSLREVGTSTPIYASTVQDISMLRHGGSVTVSGRIREVTLLDYVSLEDAIVRGSNVPLP
jgi:TIR domain